MTTSKSSSGEQWQRVYSFCFEERQYFSTNAAQGTEIAKRWKKNKRRITERLQSVGRNQTLWVSTWRSDKTELQIKHWRGTHYKGQVETLVFDELKCIILAHLTTKKSAWEKHRETNRPTHSFSDKPEANSQCNESSSTTASHGVPVGEAENSYCWNLQMTETQKAEKDKINKMHDSVTKGIIRGGRREGKTDKVKQRWRKRRGESLLLLCLKQISKHWGSFSEQVIVLAV